MQVIQNADLGGWIPNPDTIIPETNDIANPSLDGLPIDKNEEGKNEDDSDDKDGQDDIKDNEIDQNVPKIAEPLSELFEELKTNKEHNFGFYEDKKIETKEDVIDFIDINVTAKVEKELENIDTKWYQSKSPVFQQFAKMAEVSGNDITKLYEFIETQKVIDDYSTFDTTDAAQAELIVENWMKLKNEPSDIIQEEIKDLKERGIINDRAEKYKPLIVAHYEKEKQNRIIEEQNNIATFYKAVEANQENVIKHLSNKDLDGMRWSQSDKDLVYDSLSYNPELQGFNIFKDIEDLQAKGEFDRLSKIILLAKNPERFDELYVSRVKTTVAKGLRDKIRFANDTTETPDDKTTKNTKVINNNEDEFKPYVFS